MNTTIAGSLMVILKTWQRDSGNVSEAFVRNEASWRKMLIMQPSIMSLFLVAGDGSRSLTDETGIRMGILDDDAVRAEYVICYREAVCWQRVEMEEQDEVLVRLDILRLVD
jgi:hypothetical protein